MGGELRWMVAWSRIFADREYLCAMSTETGDSLRLFATVDNSLNPPGTGMACLFSTDPSQVGLTATVEERNGSAIPVVLPPGGFAVYSRVVG